MIWQSQLTKNSVIDFPIFGVFSGVRGYAKDGSSSKVTVSESLLIGSARGMLIDKDSSDEGRERMVEAIGFIGL
jgi:hypothetical protein